MNELTLARSSDPSVSVLRPQSRNRSSTRNSVELPMSHRDIADHLGLTVETVSRSLTQIEDTGDPPSPGVGRVALARCTGHLAHHLRQGLVARGDTGGAWPPA
jgi:CRP/FNR family nitrogen fixation transcriptional regulator